MSLMQAIRKWLWPRSEAEAEQRLEHAQQTVSEMEGELDIQIRILRDRLEMRSRDR